MRLVRSLASLAAFLSWGAAGACGSSTMTPDADEALACINSGRGDMYVLGLEHAGKAGLLDFKLMSAVPSPLQARALRFSIAMRRRLRRSRPRLPAGMVMPRHMRSMSPIVTRSPDWPRA